MRGLDWRGAGFEERAGGGKGRKAVRTRI